MYGKIMLKVVGIMLGGVLAGYLLRKKKMGWISGAITAAIWTLLFVLGLAVGSNDRIIGHLDTIGWQAFVLSLGAVLGSIILAKLVYRYFFKKEDI